MGRKSSIALALLMGLVAIAVPITMSLYFALRQGQQQELEHLGGLAAEVLRRSHETRLQINAAVEALKQVAAPPCSEASIARMREIDIASTYLQAVGYVADDRLMCT